MFKLIAIIIAMTASGPQEATRFTFNVKTWENMDACTKAITEDADVLEANKRLEDYVREKAGDAINLVTIKYECHAVDDGSL